MRFDTAVRDTRKVGRIPMVEWATVFYSAPPELAGKVIEVRQPVGHDVLELRFLGRIVAIHALVPPGSEPQWLPEHKTAAERVALGRRRLQSVDEVEVTALHAVIGGVDLGAGDYDVAIPDLRAMGAIGGPCPIDPPVDIAAHEETEAGFDSFGGQS